MSNEKIIKTEAIWCPSCQHVQYANVTYTAGDPWPSYCHWCEQCDYIIMESEWNVVVEEPPAPPVSEAKFVAVGSIQDGKLVIIANADRFNEGREVEVITPERCTRYLNGEKFDETVEELLGTRAAEVGLNPDSLSPTAKAAYARAVTKRHEDVHSFEALLNALRDGSEQIQTPMSEKTLEAIREERIGQEHSTTAGHPQ